MSLKSSVEKRGKVVTEIIHFQHGEKATFEGVKTDTIIQKQFTKFELEDGRLICVNDKNVNFFEVLNTKI